MNIYLITLSENENIKNMDLTFTDAYYHLYNTYDGERNKILNLNLIASRFYDDDIDAMKIFGLIQTEGLIMKNVDEL